MLLRRILAVTNVLNKLVYSNKINQFYFLFIFPELIVKSQPGMFPITLISQKIHPINQKEQVLLTIIYTIF